MTALPAATRSDFFSKTLTARQTAWTLAAILCAAFALRLGARLIGGETYFWSHGYDYLYRLAEGVVHGDGFCPHGNCERPPLYTGFLALARLCGESYLFIIIPQALMGAGTALLAFLIARRLFTPLAGLIACAIAAFYPYYVIHDTALQDTAMVTFATAVAVWLVVCATQSGRGGDWLIAGLALGAMAMVRVALLPSAIAVIVWATIWSASSGAARLRNTATLAAGVLIMVTPWLAYTWRATGTPVLSTDSGYVLWQGNNAGVFAYYPAESIDRSASETLAALPPADRAALNGLAHDRVAISRWFSQKAIDYMREAPWRTVRAAARKIEAAFSWTFNPYRGAMAQAAYAVSYSPVAVLGIAGMLLAWRETTRRAAAALVAVLFAAFIAVSAVFFAHTSHRSYLDIYWIVFAASVLTRFIGRRDTHRQTE